MACWCIPTRRPVNSSNAKSDCEINRELAQYFDNDDEFNRAINRPEGKQHTWPWATEDEVYDEIVSPSGFTFQELMEYGPVYQKYVYKKYEKGLMRGDGQPGFNTPTGRNLPTSLYSLSKEK